MVTIDVQLSDSSIRNAIKKLEKIQYELPQRANICAKKLATLGEKELNTNISGIWNFDGNEAGTTSVEQTQVSTELHWRGNQVDFLEFGTGPIGAMLPYNITLPIQWKYGNTAWVYFKDDKYHYTRGIPAYAPMLHASEFMRNKANVYKAYKGLLGKKVEVDNG